MGTFVEPSQQLLWSLQGDLRGRFIATVLILHDAVVAPHGASWHLRGSLHGHLDQISSEPSWQPSRYLHRDSRGSFMATDIISPSWLPSWHPAGKFAEVQSDGSLHKLRGNQQQDAESRTYGPGLADCHDDSIKVPTRVP